MHEIVILSTARTPMGALSGELASLTAPQLGAAAIAAAIERANVQAGAINEVLMGCVLTAGIGQAPARQAAIAGGIPHATPCTTVNKMCGSGMKTVMMAYEGLHTRPNEIFVAGGMESMSNAPYLLPKMRAGQRLGHTQALDHMFFDGLEDAYDTGRLMGTFAEDTAEKYGFTRKQQDDFALESLKRAQNAPFSAEIAPVLLPSRNGAYISNSDELPRTAKPEKIPTLKPAFREGGTVTAANSSSISDGAAALVLTTSAFANAQKLTPGARIVGVASYAHAPAWFTTAPVKAIEKLLHAINWQIHDVDLFEINEAFAVVTMAVMHDLQLHPERVNIHGGACALGHPIGASGARIIVTLLHALEHHNLKRGIAAICIGGGEATAIAIERIT